MERSRSWKGIVGPAVLAGVLGLCLAAFATGSAHARGPGRGFREPSPERAAARMAERLGLTAEQREQVRGILAESFAKRRGLREEGRSRREALREETEGRLSGVLTPEQRERLREFRERRRDRRRDCDGWRAKPGGDAPRGPRRGGE